MEGKKDDKKKKTPSEGQGRGVSPQKPESGIPGSHPTRLPPPGHVEGTRSLISEDPLSTWRWESPSATSTSTTTEALQVGPLSASDLIQNNPAVITTPPKSTIPPDFFVTSRKRPREEPSTSQMPESSSSRPPQPTFETIPGIHTTRGISVIYSPSKVPDPVATAETSSTGVNPSEVPAPGDVNVQEPEPTAGPSRVRLDIPQRLLVSPPIPGLESVTPSAILDNPDSGDEDADVVEIHKEFPDQIVKKDEDYENIFGEDNEDE